MTFHHLLHTGGASPRCTGQGRSCSSPDRHRCGCRPAPRYRETSAGEVASRRCPPPMPGDRPVAVMRSVTGPRCAPVSSTAWMSTSPAWFEWLMTRTNPWVQRDWRRRPTAGHREPSMPAHAQHRRRCTGPRRRARRSSESSSRAGASAADVAEATRGTGTRKSEWAWGAKGSLKLARSDGLQYRSLGPGTARTASTTLPTERTRSCSWVWTFRRPMC